MKKFIIPAIIIAAVALLTGCAGHTNICDDNLDNASWTAFCQQTGYDAVADNDNDKAINEYLDCWRGSVAEEQTLAKLGLHEHD